MVRYFDAEYLIREYISEVKHYGSVFHDRVVKCFAGLEDEAAEIERKERDRLAQVFSADEDSDDSYIYEKAFDESVNYFGAIDSVRKGIFNLMIAGLYHLFEQHAARAIKELTDRLQISDPPWLECQKLLIKVRDGGRGIHLPADLNELRLVSNTIKHGDGASANELRADYPHLFDDLFRNPVPVLPLQPLLGQGFSLDEDAFRRYQSAVERFWEKLIADLAPYYQPTEPAPSNSEKVDEANNTAKYQRTTGAPDLRSAGMARVFIN